MAFWGGDVARFEDLDLSINGERVALLQVEVLDRDADFGPNWVMRLEPIFVRAGDHRVAAAFTRQSDGVYDDVLQPHEWSLAGTRHPVGYGVTLLPHMRSLTILGPYNSRGGGVGDSRPSGDLHLPSDVSRRSAAVRGEEIISRLARRGVPALAHRRRISVACCPSMTLVRTRGGSKSGLERPLRRCW